MEIPYKWRVCSENHRSKCVPNCNALIAGRVHAEMFICRVGLLECTETSTHFPGWMLACGIVTELPGATQSTWDFQGSHRYSGNRPGRVQNGSKPPRCFEAQLMFLWGYNPPKFKSNGFNFFRFGGGSPLKHDPNIFRQRSQEIFKS